MGKGDHFMQKKEQVAQAVNNKMPVAIKNSVRTGTVPFFG